MRHTVPFMEVEMAEYSNIKPDAVGKVVRIMESLCNSKETLSIRDIERETDIPRSTVHRFLTSLEEQEWVYRDEETDRYRLGIRFFLLHRNDSFYEELITIAKPYMSKLVESTGKTCIMSVLEGTEGFCIHTEEPEMSMKFVAHKGMNIPLNSGATGKILLAFCADRIRNGILGGMDREKAAVLKGELEKIRSDGYAVSREEWIKHAGDISVPLFDSTGNFVAQLGIAGLVTSFDGHEEELADLVKKASRAIGKSL